jgi:hypothetical protein
MKINWEKPNLEEEIDEYFDNPSTKKWLLNNGISFESEDELINALSKGISKFASREYLIEHHCKNLTLNKKDFNSELSNTDYSASFLKIERELNNKKVITLESPILLKVNNALYCFSGNRRANIAFKYNIPIKFWVVALKQTNKQTNIIDYILKEAKVDKWSVLQENQIKNMTDQFLAKNKVKEDIEKFLQQHGKVFIFGKTSLNWEEVKQLYYKKAEFLNKEIIEKLNLQPSEEKSFLIWLLQQIYDGFIDRDHLKEDVEVIKDNLELYFKNRKEIKQNIYNVNYSKIKELVLSYKEKGFENKHKEFLSKPIVQGKEYKIYKVTEIDTCIKIGKGTSWCIQGEKWAKQYLEDGPLYLVTKNEHRFALLSFEAAQFMDVNDNNLKNEVLIDIFSIWPESQKLLEKSLKQNYKLIELIENPSEQAQIIVIEKDPIRFYRIKDKNPTENVQIAAVSRKGYIIQDIEDPSEKVQLAAVKQDGRAIRFIKNPSREVKLEALKQTPLAAKEIKEIDEQIKIQFVQFKVGNIKYIENPSKEVQMAAVTKDPEAINYIEKRYVNRDVWHYIKKKAIAEKDKNFRLYELYSYLMHKWDFYNY